MFKADQVEAIKNELGLGGGDSGGSDIGITDTGAPIGLVDSRGASGTGISLSDTDPGLRSGSASGIPLSATGSGTGTGIGSGIGSGMVLKDDTALAADVGLSGSMGGVPSPGRPGSSGLTGTAAGRSGISIFGSEENEPADPSAQTNIASNVPDQVSLESVGSGSGLLDLTRESDDTSLGAELLDEIAPTGSKAGSRGGSLAGASRAGSRIAEGTRVGGTAVAEPAITGSVRGGGGVAGPIMYEQADPMAPAFAGACLGASVFAIFGGLVLVSAMLGAKIPLVASIEANKSLSLWPLFGIGVGVSLLFFVVGWAGYIVITIGRRNSLCCFWAPVLRGNLHASIGSLSGCSQLAWMLLSIIFTLVLIHSAAEGPVGKFSYVALERDMRTVQAIVLLTLFALVGYYGIPLGSNVRGIATGYVFLLATSMLNLSLRYYSVRLISRFGTTKRRSSSPFL